ncbi:MAG: hypothetical protein FWD78_11860 [Treponema sp.]|nr:hypothetical protein [Treponema sp.]
MLNKTGFFGGFALLALVMFAAAACSNPSLGVKCSVYFYDGTAIIDGLTQTVKPGTVITLADWKDDLGNPGYTLAGWQIAGAPKVYNGKFNVKNDINFYAVWLDGVWTGIDTPAGLDGIRNDLSKNYFLMNDISLVNYATGDGWIPVGTTDLGFSGTLNGAGHKITNLMIDNEFDYAGLFGVIEGGGVCNLGVEIAAELSINFGNTGAAGITGKLDNGKIINCYSSGKITGTWFSTGGIAGEVINDSLISNCYSTGQITGYSNTGGIAGYLGDSVYAASMITNCYSTAEIFAGNTNAGGIAGYADEGAIANCAAINPSINTEGNYGRIAGLIENTTAAVENNYALDSMVNFDGSFAPDTENDGIDISEANLMDQSTWEALGWEFGNDLNKPWVMAAGGYPVFCWQ